MTTSRPTNRHHWQSSSTILAGLFLLLILAGCGQTADTVDPQRGQTASQAEAKDVNKPPMAQPQGQRFPYVPDEVLVRFKPETDADTITRILKELRLEAIHKYSSNCRRISLSIP